ncbi:MAG: hypothetical protein WC565_03710 [Parcubacteria group bacterium]
MELVLEIILLVLIIPAVYAAIIGAPTLSSSGKHLKETLEKAGVKEGIKFYELGTGTGKVSALALKMGADVTGYELSPIPYLISFLRLKTIEKPFKLRLKNFFKEDISEADVIYLFLMPKTIEKFKDKLPEATIISYAFPILGREPKYEINDKNHPPIYIY